MIEKYDLEHLLYLSDSWYIIENRLNSASFNVFHIRNLQFDVGPEGYSGYAIYNETKRIIILVNNARKYNLKLIRNLFKM